MSRRTIAIAIVLLLAGLAPATAIIGFCTRMPCCAHETANVANAAPTAEGGECCTTVTCYEAPSAQPANGITASTDSALGTPAIADVAMQPIATIVEREVVDTSPRQRLATLSLLRI